MGDHGEQTGVVVRIVIAEEGVVGIADEMGVGVRHYYKVSLMGHLAWFHSIHQLQSQSKGRKLKGIDRSEGRQRRCPHGFCALGQ
jgi:hypothetical protein